MKLRWNFFATNAPELPHWTPNSCFAAFRTILLLHDFGAERAELVLLTHKFVQRSRVGIFRNRRIRSTLLDSNSYFVAFRTISLLHQLRCKTGRTGAISALVRATKSRRKLLAANAPNPPHWTPNPCFEAFWTISLLHEHQRKTRRTGAINALLHATKICRNLLQRTHPIHPIGLKLMFWGISDRFVSAQTSVQNRPNWCDKCISSCFGAFRTSEVRATKSRWNLSQRTHPIHPIGLKLIFLGVSDHFITT
jgi:hypothetical protein